MTDQYDIFHPIENAILADYFGEKRPPSAEAIELTPLKEPPASGPVTLLEPVPASDPHAAIDNAVARIALEAIQEQLPSYGRYEDGEWQQARHYESRRNRPVPLLPQDLFSINWANSGPGASWPVFYYVTWIPFYNRFVVTASCDDPSIWGYWDIAIGFFDGGQDVREHSHQILVDEWQRALDTWNQAEWEGFWDKGLIDEDTARLWAAKVWRPEDLLTEAYELEEDLEEAVADSNIKLIDPPPKGYTWYAVGEYFEGGVAADDHPIYKEGWRLSANRLYRPQRTGLGVTPEQGTSRLDRKHTLVDLELKRMGNIVFEEASNAIRQAQQSPPLRANIDGNEEEDELPKGQESATKPEDPYGS